MARWRSLSAPAFSGSPNSSAAPSAESGVTNDLRALHPRSRMGLHRRRSRVLYRMRWREAVVSEAVVDSLWNKQKLIAQDRSVEWCCAWLMLAWAATFAMPGDSLSYPSLSGFRHHGLTEAWWTLFFVVLGGGRMIALYVNGRWPRSAVIRQIAAALGFFSWVQIGVMLYQNAPGQGAPWVPSIFVSAVLAAFELLSLRRARFDERYYKR